MNKDQTNTHTMSHIEKQNSMQFLRCVVSCSILIIWQVFGTSRIILTTHAENVGSTNIQRFNHDEARRNNDIFSVTRKQQKKRLRRILSLTKDKNQTSTNRNNDEQGGGLNGSSIINSLLETFKIENNNSDDKMDTNSTSKEIMQPDNTSAIINPDINDIRTDVVKSQLKVCKALQFDGKRSETSVSIGITYEYDIQGHSDNKYDDSDRILVGARVSEGVQQFLENSYIRPYCDYYYNNKNNIQLQNNDFRLLSSLSSKGSVIDHRYNNNSKSNSSFFAEYVRGIGSGQNQLIQDNSNEECSRGNNICWRIESTNIVYYDDNIDNILSLLNETKMQEMVLSSIADAFLNGTISKYFNNPNGSQISSITMKLASLSFIHGFAATASVRRKGDQPSFDNIETDNNDDKSILTILIVITSITVGVIIVYALVLVGLKCRRKCHQASLTPPHPSMNHTSSVENSVLPNNSEKNRRTIVDKVSTSLLKKIGVKDNYIHLSETDRKKTLGMFLQKKYEQLQFQRETFKNQKQGRFELKDEADDHSIIFNNDTMESLESASFDDEFGMEMMLRQMEREENKRSGIIFDGSTLFDTTDAFASNSFGYSSVGPNSTFFHNDSRSMIGSPITIKSSQNETEIIHLSMDADYPKHTSVTNSLSGLNDENENTRNNKPNLDCMEGIPICLVNADTSCYFSGDEGSIPYDEEQYLSLKSRDDNGNTSNNSNKENCNKGGGHVSFLQVTLSEDSLVLNTTVESASMLSNNVNSKGLLSNSTGSVNHSNIEQSSLRASWVSKGSPVKHTDISDTVDL
jgi:hypothetical protein